MHSIKNAFDAELREAGVMIGLEVMKHINTAPENETIDRSLQEDTRRKIERIKINGKLIRLIRAFFSC